MFTANLHPGDQLWVGSTVLELVSASTPDIRLAPSQTTTSLNLVGDQRGQTLGRRTVDPSKLGFLTQVLEKNDDPALLESAQRYLSTLLAVADFLDALTSDRSYRAARPIDEVVALIEEQSGLAFDPAVVAAAVTLREKGELVLPVAPGPSLR